MVFGKKKAETVTEKKQRLEKELAAVAAEEEKALTPPSPPEPPTMVQEMKNDKKGDAEAYESFIESAMSRFESSFPELGPSGHAHVERTLLVAILAKLEEIREALKK